MLLRRAKVTNWPLKGQGRTPAKDLLCQSWSFATARMVLYGVKNIPRSDTEPARDLDLTQGLRLADGRTLRLDIGTLTVIQSTAINAAAPSP